VSEPPRLGSTAARRRTGPWASPAHSPSTRRHGAPGSTPRRIVRARQPRSDVETITTSVQARLAGGAVPRTPCRRREAHMPPCAQSKLRRDHSPPPVDHLADFLGALVTSRISRCWGDSRPGTPRSPATSSFSGFGRRDDERPLAEAEGAIEIHDALRLRVRGTRCIGRLERKGHGSDGQRPDREIGRAVGWAAGSPFTVRHATLSVRSVAAAADRQRTDGSPFAGDNCSPRTRSAPPWVRESNQPVMEAFRKVC